MSFGLDHFYHFRLIRSELWDRLFVLFGAGCVDGDIVSKRFTKDIRLYKHGVNVSNLHFNCLSECLTVHWFAVPYNCPFKRFEFHICSPSFFDDVVNLCVTLMRDQQYD